LTVTIAIGAFSKIRFSSSTAWLLASVANPHPPGGPSLARC
jgi:hypothetical protein